MTDDSRKTRLAALNLLARRDYTSQQLADKLRDQSHDETAIENVIQELQNERLLNDLRYIENFIHSRRNKGYGPERIRQELNQKGVNDEAIADQLDIPDNVWSMLARQVWRKQFKGRQPDNYQEKAKHMRFLQYRGFTIDQINSVFDDEEM